MTTTPFDRTAASAISHQPLTPTAALPTRNGTGRCATPGAPRPVPLLHRANWAQINLGLCSSLDEKRGSDQYRRAIVACFVFRQKISRRAVWDFFDSIGPERRSQNILLLAPLLGTKRT